MTSPPHHVDSTNKINFIVSYGNYKILDQLDVLCAWTMIYHRGASYLLKMIILSCNLTRFSLFWSAWFSSEGLFVDNKTQLITMQKGDFYKDISTSNIYYNKL